MKNKKFLYVTVGAVLIVLIGVTIFCLVDNPKSNKENQSSESSVLSVNPTTTVQTESVTPTEESSPLATSTIKTEYVSPTYAPDGSSQKVDIEIGIKLRDNPLSDFSDGHKEAVQSIRMLSASKEQKLEQLILVETRQWASYDRLRKEIELGETIDRITLSEVQKIIAQNEDYSTIEKLLLLEHGGADVSTGSGISSYDIWLNDDGTERICMSLGQIHYASLTASGRLF